MLVVSPLLALMRDQLAHLPRGVPAAMLWGAQPRHEATATLQALSVRSLYRTARTCVLWSHSQIEPADESFGHSCLHVGVSLPRSHSEPSTNPCRHSEPC